MLNWMLRMPIDELERTVLNRKLSADERLSAASQIRGETRNRSLSPTLSRLVDICLSYQLDDLINDNALSNSVIEPNIWRYFQISSNVSKQSALNAGQITSTDSILSFPHASSVLSV